MGDVSKRLGFEKAENEETIRSYRSATFTISKLSAGSLLPACGL